MQHTPLISVVIPVYNVEEYFDKCMQSVLNQTYQNLEIILVDDGSTDASGRMCDMYAAQDTRVRVLHKENGGVSAARNDALRIATGEWIGFVDADDYIDEKMYETMLLANQNEKADIISCGYYLVYGNRTVLAENKKPVPNKVVDTKAFLRYVYERDVYKGVASYLWTRLLSRELLYDNNGEMITTFAIDLDVSEDLVFLAEVMLRSRKSLYIECPMYYYSQRENSSCHNERKQLDGLSWIRAYKRILEIFGKNPIDEDVYNLVVRMMVFRCGKFMELAIKYQEQGVYDELKGLVKKYYLVYENTNKDYPERIAWLNSLLENIDK